MPLHFVHYIQPKVEGGLIFKYAIDQLHTRAKEFNWRDVTSGCSFAATLSIAVNGEIGRWAVETRA